VKRSLSLALGLVLALPVISFAGSATSKWDLAIGGYVKFDVGWAGQSAGLSHSSPWRRSEGLYQTLNGKYGDYTYSAVDSLLKGPEEWHTRSSALVGHDLRASSGSLTGGTFFPYRRPMSLDWLRTKSISGFDNTLPLLGAARQPQIRIQGRVAKDWTFLVTATSPTNTVAATGSRMVENYSLSGRPFLEGSIGWTTDSYGKIGSWGVLVFLDGFYGQQKQTTVFANIPVSGTLLNTPYLFYRDSTLDSWGVALKAAVPMIGEKKGTRSGSLGVSGALFTGQNPSWYQPPSVSYSSCGRPIDVSVTPSNYPLNDFIAPRLYGAWGQVTYYLTNDVVVNGYYGYLRNELSQRYMNVNASPVISNAECILNLLYDVNPAIRVGVEYAYIRTAYANYTQYPKNGAGTSYSPSTSLHYSGPDKEGTLHSVRIGAFYFF
jgi:hypothetical protein